MAFVQKPRFAQKALPQCLDCEKQTQQLQKLLQQINFDDKRQSQKSGLINFIQKLQKDDGDFTNKQQKLRQQLGQLKIHLNQKSDLLRQAFQILPHTQLQFDQTQMQSSAQQISEKYSQVLLQNKQLTKLIKQQEAELQQYERYNNMSQSKLDQEQRKQANLHKQFQKVAQQYKQQIETAKGELEQFVEMSQPQIEALIFDIQQIQSTVKVVESQRNRPFAEQLETKIVTQNLLMFQEAVNIDQPEVEDEIFQSQNNLAQSFERLFFALEKFDIRLKKFGTKKQTPIAQSAGSKEVSIPASAALDQIQKTQQEIKDLQKIWAETPIVPDSNQQNAQLIPVISENEPVYDFNNQQPLNFGDLVTEPDPLVKTSDIPAIYESIPICVNQQFAPTDQTVEMEAQPNSYFQAGNVDLRKLTPAAAAQKDDLVLTASNLRASEGQLLSDKLAPSQVWNEKVAHSHNSQIESEDLLSQRSQSGKSKPPSVISLPKPCFASQRVDSQVNPAEIFNRRAINNQESQQGEVVEMNPSPLVGLPPDMYDNVLQRTGETPYTPLQAEGVGPFEIMSDPNGIQINEYQAVNLKFQKLIQKHEKFMIQMKNLGVKGALGCLQ